MKPSFSHSDTYLRYLKLFNPLLDPKLLARIDQIFQNTNWEDPETGLDWNNLAVIALIEAEQNEESILRSAYVESAMEALTKGLELGCPLCSAHLSILLSLTGQLYEATQIAFSRLINILYPVHDLQERIGLGLVYLPRIAPRSSIIQKDRVEFFIQLKNEYHQSLVLLSEALCYSQIVFYNSSGLRFLQLANQIVPTSASINLKLGISSLLNCQPEGLLYLHRANQADPKNSLILQSLYLGYSNLNKLDIANFWRSHALSITNNADNEVNGIEWQWSRLPTNSPFTYLPFESIVLAVEPSCRSIVTSVLLAEGDWFEKEMEFWRYWIQPNMTVIDVGANVGVYTFSAALRVGPTGRVIAVEPFSGCVRCLRETCRINQIDWVTVRAGAASDRIGTAKLSLNSASELNSIVTKATKNQNYEEVSTFTIDSLIEQEKLDRLDILKIDAEGHEVPILLGSEKTLKEFYPVIMYENIAGHSNNNLPVFDFLKSREYDLFVYKPYIKDLSKVNSVKDLDGQLNIIAFHKNKLCI